MDEVKKNIEFREEGFKSLSEEEQILEVASGFVPPVGESKKAALKKLKSRMGDSNPMLKRKISYSYWAAAAMILALIGIYFGFINSNNITIITQNSQQQEVVLPDGSLVVLNSGSKLEYAKKGFTKNRKINVSGEVFMDVQTGEGFEIVTTNGVIKIMGTKLNILSRNDLLEVDCIEGKVGVFVKNKQEIITAGESVKLLNNNLLKRNIEDANSQISWIDGIFNFEDEPLDYIFDELERQFNVTFELPQIENRNYTGGFKNDNLEYALDQVCIPMGLNYEIKKSNKIIVSEAPDM